MPEININQLADFIKTNFAIDIEVRKNIFSNVKKTTATQLASCRIFNTRKPFEFHSPSAEEIEFEKNSNIFFSNAPNFWNFIYQL